MILDELTLLRDTVITALSTVDDAPKTVKAYSGELMRITTAKLNYPCCLVNLANGEPLSEDTEEEEWGGKHRIQFVLIDKSLAGNADQDAKILKWINWVLKAVLGSSLTFAGSNREYRFAKNASWRKVIAPKDGNNNILLGLVEIYIEVTY